MDVVWGGFLDDDGFDDYDIEDLDGGGVGGHVRKVVVMCR